MGGHFLFPSPGDLLNPGIEPGSPTLQADSLPSEPLGKPNLEIIYEFIPPLQHKGDNSPPLKTATSVLRITAA